MKHDKLRQRIALEAARRMYEHRESFHTAKLKAAQLIIGGWVKPKLLPSHREIRAEIEQLARLHEASDERLLPPREETDRFAIYRSLLLPLEQVRQNARWHPEGDALYHSLQVFDLARNELPYDEEFLLAALLHDVGKAIDPKQHAAAGLEALVEIVTPRTCWLIEHQGEAQALLDNELGVRARRRLAESEHFEELLVLARCDRAGRATGVAVPEVDEALDYIRELAEMCGD
ncbi:MAG TPA: HD domain-containing protein [Pirellulales bacterium]|nr:HD domain-containing protein [Pirellulales bacterium]